MNRNCFYIWLLAGITALSCTMLLSQTTEPPKSEEYLLLGSPNRGGGEPMVFVNPKDANNIIVVAMATLNRLPTGEAPIRRGSPGAVEMRVKELSTPDGSRTDIAITHDGGKTWNFSEDNFRKALNKNRCSDSFAGAGPDGTLYMGCLAYLERGDAAFADGYGRTWSQAVVAAQVAAGSSFGHRAMKYSAKGDLALMWKANYGEGTYDVWSSASRDGGRTFKTVRVSHAVSPARNPDRNNFGFGDDLSSIDIDDQFVHVVWGDNRSGFEATWYGRVPLSAY